MGNIVVKMNRKYYKDNSDIETLLAYIAGETKNKEKTRYYNGRGLAKDCRKAAKTFIKVQKKYGKAKQRRLYHLFVSFPEEINDTNYVKLVAENIANLLFDKHQIYYGVHEDTDNLHIHLAINAVSYVDGRKWHQSKKEFEEMKKRIRKVAEEIYREGFLNPV